MANNTRQWAHRKIDFAIGNLKTSGCHLLEIMEKYQENHPKIAEGLFIVNKILVEMADQLENIKRSF